MRILKRACSAWSRMRGLRFRLKSCSMASELSASEKESVLLEHLHDNFDPGECTKVMAGGKPVYGMW